MSLIGSSLSKGEDGTALINASVLNQIAGLPKDLTRAAFDAAVTKERANITNNGVGIWNNGEKISIFGELGTRLWFVGSSAALSHGRNVSYQGKTYTLGADANVFGATVGVPAASAGANGDMVVDAAAGLIYGPKASGAWPAGVPASANTLLGIADLQDFASATLSTAQRATAVTVIAVPGVGDFKTVPAIGGGTSPFTLSGNSIVATVQPSFSWTTAPTYATTGQKFGSGALAGGVGELDFLIPIAISGGVSGAPLSLGLLFKSATTTAFTATADFLQLVDSAGNVFGIRFSGMGYLINTNGTLSAPFYNLRDQTYHGITFYIADNTVYVYIDGANYNVAINGTGPILQPGPGKVLLDLTQMATGDLLDKLVSMNGTSSTLTAIYPTSETTTVPSGCNLLVDCNFNGDGSNSAAAAAPTVLNDATAIKTDTTLAIDPVTKKLSVPQLYVNIPVLALPQDGRGFSTTINNFITQAVRNKRTSVILGEGWVRLNSSILQPLTQFDIVGMGSPDGAGAGYWGGGTKLEVAYNGTFAAVAMIGPGNTNGDTGGYVIRPSLRSICLTGTKNRATATGGYNQALLEMQFVYKALLENITGGNDFFCFLRVKSGWDSDNKGMKINFGGFSIATDDPAAAATMAYTGRSGALEAESYAGRSFGVGAVEMFGVDPAGQAVTNNFRTEDMHIEACTQEGVSLIHWGANVVNNSFTDCKIEVIEPSVPLIVLDQAHEFNYKGWLAASGARSQYAAVPANPTATGIKGGLVLAANSFNPRIVGSGSYLGGGGNPDALFTFKGCTNPVVHFGVEDGLSHVKTARTILADCTKVSPYEIRVVAADYVPGSTLKTIALQGTTTLDPALTTVTAGGATFVAAPWPPVY